MSDPVNNSAIIATNLPCAFCGYNLRSLESNGLCPECGQDISTSIRGDFLIHEPSPWLARLVSGTTILLVSSLLFLLFSLIMVIAANSGLRWAPLYTWMRFLYLAIPLLELLGIWKITSRPAASDISRRQSLRLWSRAAALFTLLCLIPEYFDFCIRPLSNYILTIAVAVRDVLLLLCLREYAKRVPSRTLAFHCMALACGTVLYHLMNVVLLMSWNAWIRWSRPSIEFFLLIFQLSAMTRVSWQTILLFVLRARFRKIAALSRELTDR